MLNKGISSVLIGALVLSIIGGFAVLNYEKITALIVSAENEEVGSGLGVIFYLPDKFIFVPSEQIVKVISIKNQGDNDLSGCYLEFEGIWTDWQSDSELIRISPGEKFDYNIVFSPPANITSGEYTGKIILICGEGKDSLNVPFKVTYKSFEAKFVGYTLDKTAFRASFLLEDRVSKSQKIWVNYSLTGLDGVSIGEDFRVFDLVKDFSEEKEVTLEIPEGVFGEFNLDWIAYSGKDLIEGKESILILSEGSKFSGSTKLIIAIVIIIFIQMIIVIYLVRSAYESRRRRGPKVRFERPKQRKEIWE